MFNVQGSELIFLLLIALIVLGPEKLPSAVRKFVKTYTEFKKMANGFQGELKQAFEEPLRELRGTADALKAAATFDDDTKAKPKASSPAATPAESTTDAASLSSRPTPAVSEVQGGKLNFGVPVEPTPAERPVPLTPIIDLATAPVTNVASQTDGVAE